MKKIFLLCSFISIFFLACEDDFDPKTSVPEKYVLYAMTGLVLNIPGEVKTGYFNKIKLSRVYNIEQYDITKYSVEPVVGADVVIKFGSNFTKCFEEFSRLDNEVSYVPRESVPINPNQLIEITATLPDRKSISAQTKMLNYNFFTRDYPFFNGFTSKLNRFLWGNSFDLHWENNKNPNLFFCNLSVYYSEKTDSGEVFYTKKLPYRLGNNDGKLEFIYPSYQFVKSISFDYNAIDSAIASIGAGKQDKSKIMLYYLTMSLLEYNSDLTYYFSSIHGYTDRFSIRLDEKIYTNVAGGIGIFGTTSQLTEKMYFHPDYPGIFGYKVFMDW